MKDTKEVKKSPDSGTIVKRGSIVCLKNVGANTPSYLVYVVWRDNGLKKWFPTDSYSEWPASDTDG